MLSMFGVNAVVLRIHIAALIARMHPSGVGCCVAGQRRRAPAAYACGELAGRWPGVCLWLRFASITMEKVWRPVITMNG